MQQARYATNKVVDPRAFTFFPRKVGDVAHITTNDTNAVWYNFHITAINNAPKGSNVLELIGQVSYVGFPEVKAKIWIRRDGRVTFGVDTHDLARLEQSK